MERVKSWAAEVAGGIASALCWFTPAHCDYVATLLAMLIGFVTFFFITLPKAMPRMRSAWRKIFK